MFPMEKDPLTAAAAKARFVAPPKFAAVHYEQIRHGQQLSHMRVRLTAYITANGATTALVR
jgi:hypothetical protein